jgi:hypothetical protein
MAEFVIAIDDPRDPEIRQLLDRHLAFAEASTPAEHIHALGPSASRESDRGDARCRQAAERRLVTR